jgi:hypothetical protein
VGFLTWLKLQRRVITTHDNNKKAWAMPAAQPQHAKLQRLTFLHDYENTSEMRAFPNCKGQLLLIVLWNFVIESL